MNITRHLSHVFNFMSFTQVLVQVFYFRCFIHLCIYFFLIREALKNVLMKSHIHHFTLSFT